TDTNFGNIFSIWDRLFGTYAAVDNTKLIYGVDTFMADKEHKNIGTMLRIPFMPIRKPTDLEQEL
ncbi:MAG: sterol desaturase, partial [Bacteroidota bacterium]